MNKCKQQLRRAIAKDYQTQRELDHQRREEKSNQIYPT